MEKFSKIEKTKIKPDVIDLKPKSNIMDYKDSSFFIDNDQIVILPYLKDEGYILLTYESIPTYQYKYKDVGEYKNTTNFLTVIKGDIIDETPLQSVRRNIIQKTGVILNSNYLITIDKTLFRDPKTTGQYYISLLEINYNDFKQGSLVKSLDNNRVVKVSLGDINDIKTFDLITDYMLLKLKYDYKI